MWRLIVGFSTIFFSLAALAGAVLLVVLAIDHEWRPAIGVGLSTIVFTWGAWACRRDWQREQQAREFRRENAREER